MKHTLLILFILLFASNAIARRGEPNVLATGYYAVDSDDDAPEPWKVTPYFVDTTYQPASWIRIQSGPRQNRVVVGNYFFFRPDQTADYSKMDTTNDCLAGPISIGMNFNYYGTYYNSITISSNGYIGFLGSAQGYALQTTPAGRMAMYAERNDAADFLSYPSYAPKAIVAALFADLDMIPGSDSTKVFVRQSPAHDTFYVNFYNMRIRPRAPNAVFNGRSNDKLFISKMQIVLTRSDFGITINYGPFHGVVQTLPMMSAARAFGRNSTIGVMNESATQYTSFLAGTHVLNGRYDATANTSCAACNGVLPDSGGYSIRFKRWRNIVRAKSVDMPSRNFELVLGNSLQPQATFQNVDLNQHSIAIAAKFTNVVTGTSVYAHSDTMLGLLRLQSRSTLPVNFPIYSTNPNTLLQLGTFRATMYATGKDPQGRDLGDTWPFDDSVTTTFFGIRTSSLPFHDPNDSYSKTADALIPDQTHWVSQGATVVEGNEATFDPPPPRSERGNGIGTDSILDAVVVLDRFDANGLPYRGNNVGDTLESFPYNLLGQTKATISFDYQRTGKMDFPLYWDGDVLYGPENTINYSSGAIARVGDSLFVEVKSPGSLTSGSWRTIYSIDGGNDLEFKHVSIALDSLKFGSSSYFSKDLRFRIRLKANDNGVGLPDDDGDPFYLDNVSLTVPRLPELEITWTRVVTPYTHMPPSQMTQLPVYVHVANNGSAYAIPVPIKVEIRDDANRLVYSKSQSVANLRGRWDTIVAMPTWDASQLYHGGMYHVVASIASNYDEYPQDNSTYSDFYLPFMEPGAPAEFAYDDGVNDMPTTPTVDNSPGDPRYLNFQQPGKGIGYHDLSGSFAMKFETVNLDSLYGIRAYFASGNQSDDPIRITILKGKPGSCVPTTDTVFTAQMNDVREGQLFDLYWPYYFPRPVVLPKGIYWVVVSQLSLNNYFLGGTTMRGGARIGVTDPQLPIMTSMYRDPFGTNIGDEHNTGDVSCAFAMETVAGSGSWAPFIFDTGYWSTTYPMAFSNYLTWGTYICNPCQQLWAGPTYWNYAGTYFPMIRAMFAYNVLPVEMLYFHAREDHGKALLTWATAEERDNSGFIVERHRVGEDVQSFENIGFVGGSGSTTKSNGYSFVDGNLQPGRYIYRLRQIDLDGSTHLSNTAEVSIGDVGGFSFEVRNSSEGGANVKIIYTLTEAAPTTLTIYDGLGRLVRVLCSAQEPSGTTTLEFNGLDDSGQPLPSGVYFANLRSGQLQVSQKFTIVR